MPKRVKNRRHRKDPNELAFDAVRQTIALAESEPEAKPPSFAAQLSAYMSRLGKKGGKVSGQRRMANLSEQQRREIASRAARKRWDEAAKRKGAKKR
jgi:hypothetical protein